MALVLMMCGDQVALHSHVVTDASTLGCSLVKWNVSSVKCQVDEIKSFKTAFVTSGNELNTYN